MIKKKKQNKKNPETIIEHKELFTYRERGERERERGPKVENYCTVKTKSFSKTFE